MNLLLLLCCTFIGTITSESISSKFIKYVLTVSKAVVSGSHTTACLLTQNTQYPLELTLQFDYASTKDTFQITKGYECVQLNVPAVNTTSTPTTRLRMTLIRKEGDHISNMEGLSSHTITVLDPEEPMYQIDLSKTVYKVGDVILCRIVQTNQFEEPVNDKIKSVVLRNEEGDEMMSWKDLKAKNGIIHIEYEIKDEVQEVGELWSLEVNDGLSRTEIPVLPINSKVIFNVHPEYPEWVSSNATNITVKLCATDYKDQPLIGTAQLILIPTEKETEDKKAKMIEEEFTLKDGCAQMEVPMAKLKSLNNVGETFNIHYVANVMDNENGKQEHHIIRVTPEKKPCDLRIDMAQPRSRPGIPSIGVVALNNREENLNNTNLQICYKVMDLAVPDEDEDVFKGNSNPRHCVNVIIGEDENYEFTIPPLKFNLKKKIKIGARIVEYPSHKVSTVVYTTTFSHNGLSMLPVGPKNVEECKDHIEFMITYTQNNISKIEGFNVILTNRNGPIKTEFLPAIGTKRIFNESNYENVLPGESDVILESAEFYEMPYSMKTSDIKTADPKIFIYYLANEEVLSDGRTLDLTSCLKHKTEATWEKGEVKMGETAKLKISTTKNAVCSVFVTKGYKRDYHVPDMAPEDEIECPNSTIYDDKAFHTLSVLQSADVHVLTNQNIFTPCVNDKYSDNTFTKRSKREVTAAEFHFIDNETFMWNLLPPAKDNIVYVEGTVPNVTGYWITSVVCSSPEKHDSMVTLTTLKVI